MSVKVGSFDVYNGWPGRLELPWAADGLILWTVCQSEEGYLSHADFAGYTGDTGISVGLADRISGNQQCILSSSDQQAFAPYNRSSRGTFGDRIVARSRAPSATDPSDYLTIASWSRCGVHFSTIGTESYRVYYVAFAGATLNTASGIVTMPADGSNGSVTGLSFDPSADPSLLIAVFGEGSDATGPGITSVGWADGTLEEQSQWFINYNNVGGSASGAAGIAGFTGGSGWNSNFVSFDSTGFTLSQSAGGADRPVLYLVLTDAAGAFHVDTAAWPTTSGSITAPGFQPEAVLFSDYITGEEPTDGQITLGATGAYPPNTTPITAAGLAGVGDTDNQRRWTAQETDTTDVLLDYVGDSGSESGNVAFGGFTADGFDWDGVASGYAGDIRYAAILTSEVGQGAICRRGALPILGVG